MTVLAEGALTDRPWGRTLMSLAARGISAQVDVASGGKTYSLVLEGGAVTGARSPLATDAAARLALTAGMITSTHVAEHARRARAEPGVDEVSLLAQIAGLSPDVTLRLRRRVIATQAIRPVRVRRRPVPHPRRVHRGRLGRGRDRHPRADPCSARARTSASPRCATRSAGTAGSSPTTARSCCPSTASPPPTTP
jgi:hypothetical protein